MPFLASMALMYVSKVGDLVVFYAPDNGDKKVLCLVELKGKDIKHAVEQVTNPTNSV